ncbi:MAG: hypothetical protein ACLQVF_34825 [Isosphaeraceae bacterium]
MSDETMSTLIEKADAAFWAAAAQVIKLARQTGTPVIVWEDGRIVEKTAEEAEMELRKKSSHHALRDKPPSRGA